MADSSNITQHLEMMLNKKNRCEDWVASVASRKHCSPQRDNLSQDDDLDYVEEEFSDLCDSSEGPKRRLRKSVKNKHLSLILTCEWQDCNFSTKSSRMTFVQHVSSHIPNLLVIKKTDNTLCYQCLWQSCDFQSANPADMKRHVNHHSYHSILKAVASELHNKWEFQECVLSNENRNWVPDMFTSFECRVADCDFTIDNFYQFINHVETHVESQEFVVNKKIPCIWRDCFTFKCTRKMALKIHMRSHTGEKLLACPTCGAMFATNTKYMDHCTRKIAVQNESNQCQYCLRYYPNERLLRDHLRYHINSQKCSFCEMTFSTPAVLANHVRYKHLSSRPFKCTLCSFSTARADDYNAHLTVHESEPKYQCHVDECSYSCRSITAFKKHFLSAHLKEQNPIYKCHLCDKEYNRGPSLGMHLRTIHKLERLPGHSRFRYMKNKDGFFRLQVERYDRVELNIKTPIATIEERDCEVIVTHQQKNDLPREIFVSVRGTDMSEKGALITIEEMDERGNLIRSSTVHEELVNDLPSDVLLVNSEDPLVEKENASRSMDLEKAEKEYASSSFVDSRRPFENGTNIVADNGRISKRPKATFFVKRKRKTLQLADGDFTNSELVFKDE